MRYSVTADIMPSKRGMRDAAFNPQVISSHQQVYGQLCSITPHLLYKLRFEVSAQGITLKVGPAGDYGAIFHDLWPGSLGKMLRHKFVYHPINDMSFLSVLILPGRTHGSNISFIVELNVEYLHVSNLKPISINVRRRPG